ncbi:UDP-glucose 4-epimerase [Reticulibacter mediterranei]|uniref:UDP-glucose 4-epimerase n=1 Tax=Reticulibacter mediterranei TaxID=2778369 RepID=A0A8J3IS10_9CHLR|nr:NAD-dependent epimerase/dehydratase family protein [Reticulibacter mediterranei]GHO95802.1 UDP-glucose 4-epimerase [Reticulibacter mediterranei]
MKIAITGGAGFIGAHLTRSYLDAGHDVLVIDNLCRGSRQAVDPRARLYEIDVRDKKLRSIVQQERPEIVSHHVAQWQHHLPFEQALPDADVHIHGLLNVLDCCIDGSVKKIIFASGGNSMYGQVEADQLPLSEATPLCPQQSIDISRTAGEWYIRHYHRYYGLQYTILRYASIYGNSITDPADMRHPINYFISLLTEQRRPIIRGTGEERHDHLFIDDVIRANHSVIKQGNNQTLHISSGQSYALNQIYQMVATAMKSELQAVYLSGSLTNSTIALDNMRAKQTLNWQPTISLQEGIYQTIKRTYSTQKITEPLSIERIPIPAGAIENLQTVSS